MRTNSKNSTSLYAKLITRMCTCKVYETNDSEVQDALNIQTDCTTRAKHTSPPLDSGIKIYRMYYQLADTAERRIMIHKPDGLHSPLA